VIYEPSFTAVAVFSAFVAFTLGLSFYFAGKTKSAQSYFAAGGQIHWFVNGVAFAGDYLSAASFLGICGMIAFYGDDGTWISRRLGRTVGPSCSSGGQVHVCRYARAKQLPALLAAGDQHARGEPVLSVPQMVARGTCHCWASAMQRGFALPARGGADAVTAGMVSTTYVQFQGSLLVVFSTILTVAILNRVESHGDTPARTLCICGRGIER
jgi:cation/acetate symporter